MLREGRNIIRT